MPSTNFITGTGFIKCMPTTSPGRLVWAAMAVMEMDEVLEARITPGLATSSNFLKISYFNSTRSVAASTMKSASFTSLMEPLAVILSITDFAVAASIFPFSTRRPKSFSIFARPACARSKETSPRRIFIPLWAATCAMPAPICPAPITAKIFI